MPGNSILIQAATAGLLVAAAASPVRAQTVPPTDSSLARAISGPARSARGSTGRLQVFSEPFSATTHGPYWVNLDSGIAYHIIVDQNDTLRVEFTIAPRRANLAPIRVSPTMFSGSSGAPFRAPVATSYKVETSYAGSNAILVRIFRDALDAPLIGDDTVRPHHGLSPAVVILIGFLPVLFVAMMRNGRDF